MNHTGVASTGWRRQARRKRSFTRTTLACHHAPCTARRSVVWRVMMLTGARQAAAIGVLLAAGAAAWIGCDALAGIASGELAAGADASVDGTVGDAAAGDGAPGEGAAAEASSDADAGPACADGGLACDGGCVDPSKDEGNCGSCGATCATGFN